MTRHVVRHASMSELETLLALFAARVDWIVDRHRSDQWSSVGRWRDMIEYNIEVGATWVLCDGGADGEIVGTVTLSRNGDPAFWGGSPVRETLPALYLAKLATDPRRAGERLGDLLIDWAVDLAFRADLLQVRLDAWKTATGLHRYYLDRGWRQLGTVDVRGRRSGTLFTRAPEKIDLGRRLVPTGEPGPSGTCGRWSAFRDDRYLNPLTAVGLVSDDAMEGRPVGDGDCMTSELPQIVDLSAERVPVPLG